MSRRLNRREWCLLTMLLGGILISALGTGAYNVKLSRDHGRSMMAMHKELEVHAVTTAHPVMEQRYRDLVRTMDNHIESVRRQHPEKINDER